MTNKLPIAILGATGMVGQKAIALLENHPLFYVAEMSASKKRVGNVYKDPLDIQSKHVISALPSDVAHDIEMKLAERGHLVFSNASAFRMNPNVPILIPEINLDHLSLIDGQKTPGKIITNSNCTTAFIALALAPLLKIYPIKEVSAFTMQAISGAGHPGVSSLDILGNIIPHIPSEEEKIVQETHKILGTPTSPATFDLTVNVNRVPIVDGHTIILHIHFDLDVELSAITACYEALPYKLYDQADRPQPRLDISPFDMRAHIGRIKYGANKKTISLIVMGHNLVRGAAGASLLNLETIQSEIFV
ncbi:MAG: Aspartate-semialdehyde dehydrogenase [Chlamydiia bacterium]|nr:Aspartate-semialdehyde dehydrogenase [Chlamydiia bacterium]MCH9615330.1 Aspartate-semialdehyde dehydrogenase [Chlamydiia bacterium]MCH9628348.1 Aspartate-semialdehyde dehydrogenase [Chlamydiia bacterium]